MKQVDKDGKFNYSIIVKVIIIKTEVEYMVYPNPAVDKSTVRILSDMNKATIRLNDALGKVMYMKTFNAIKAGEEIEIPVKGFGKGVYVLIISTDKGLVNEKIVVQ